MEAALVDAGEVDDVGADVGRFVPLCVAKVKTAALKLKIQLDGPHEVFQVWEQPEEDEEGGESCFVSPGGVDPAEKYSKRGASGIKSGAGGGGGRGTRGKGGVSTGGDPAVGFPAVLPAATSITRGGLGAPITYIPRVPYCTTAEIKGYSPEYARPVVYRFFHHEPSVFSLEEESTIQPSRHTHAPATELECSANVLSIKVPSSSVGYPVNLYGSVYVRDDLDRKRVYLFRRDRDDSQLVTSPEETLALTGPSRGLLVFDNLFFEIDLKMKCDQKVDDMSFSQGSIHFSRVYNSSWLLRYRSYLLTDELATEVSNVELRYAVVQRAVEASIQIKVREGLTHRVGESFSGKVTAFITGISVEMVLFDSEASGIVMNIRDDGSLELWRSVISVPIDGSLKLRVETWEGGSKANVSICSTIFMPQICDEDFAPCTFHPIWIKVAWSPLYVPKFDDHKIMV